MSHIVTALLGISLSFVSYSAMAGENFTVEGTGTHTSFRSSSGSSAEIANFSGSTSDITVDDTNWCFESAPQANFSWGDRIAFNSFWSDTVTADVMNFHVVLAVVSPTGQVVPLLSYRSEFTGLAPWIGQQIDFCAAEFIQTPAGRPPAQYPWGKRVAGTSGPAVGLLGTVILQ